MKAALEGSREGGRATAVSISGRRKAVIFTHRVRKREKEQGQRAAGNSTFPLIPPLKTEWSC